MSDFFMQSTVAGVERNLRQLIEQGVEQPREFLADRYRRDVALFEAQDDRDLAFFAKERLRYLESVS